jgi:predicted Zn finger-like uncharacterized protein
MTVQCPHCATRYELPGRLIGAGGAEVRCPRCRRNFLVSSDGVVLSPAAPAGGPRSAHPEAREPARPDPRGPARPAAEAGPTATGAGSGPTGGAAERPGPAAQQIATAPDPHVIARAVLGDLAERSGDPLAEAGAQGRLFSEFGPALLGAFDEYRRRVGAGAQPGPFREALRERWGIELEPRWGEDPATR